jgi:hypothetical protein
VKSVDKHVPRDAILTAIRDNLVEVSKWAALDNFAKAQQHHARAEGLIELLERVDCGVSGGFDQERKQPSMWRLQDRFHWLRDLPQCS